MFITQERAFSLGLPKWPQFLMTGKPVTVEQAKEIIFKTDSFFQDIDKYGGGNNHRWNAWAHEVLGYKPLIDQQVANEKAWQDYWKVRDAIQDKEAQAKFEEENRPNNAFGDHWQKRDAAVLKLGFVKTQYLRNSWASCNFIHGPHGWCSPDGVLCHVDNLGKWPSVEEIYDDIKKIKDAFPYLVFTGTLYDGESCEENTNPIVTFVVDEEGIRFTLDHKSFHHEVKGPDRSDDHMLSRFANDYSEQGLPQSWIVEYGLRTKPVMEWIMNASQKEIDTVLGLEFINGLVDTD